MALKSTHHRSIRVQNWGFSILDPGPLAAAEALGPSPVPGLGPGAAPRRGLRAAPEPGRGGPAALDTAYL